MTESNLPFKNQFMDLIFIQENFYADILGFSWG